MNRIYKCLFGLMMVGTSALTAMADMVTRERLAVDTVKAMQMIGEKISRHNQPYTKLIERLETECTDITSRLKENEDSLQTFKNMQNSISSNVKNKDITENIALFLQVSFGKLPEDLILSYAKPKDVEKAKKSINRELELLKLANKIHDSHIKKARKGDFSSGYAAECLSFLSKQVESEKARLNAALMGSKEEINAAKSNLLPLPDKFTAELWLSEMPEQTEVPTKIITETRPRKNEDDLSYDEAIERFGMPEHEYYGSEHFTISGKFNGLLDDKLTVFPVQQSLIPNYWYELDNRNIPVYTQVIIKSERGTVPDLIVNYDDLEYEPGYGEIEDTRNNVPFVPIQWPYNNSLHVSNLNLPDDFSLSVEKTEEVFDKNKSPQFSMLISYSSYDTGPLIATYRLVNGAWVKEKPLRDKPFDELMQIYSEEIAANKIPIIKSNWVINGDYYSEEDYREYNRGNETVALIPLATYRDEDGIIKPHYALINDRGYKPLELSGEIVKIGTLPAKQISNRNNLYVVYKAQSSQLPMKVELYQLGDEDGHTGWYPIGEGTSRTSNPADFQIKWSEY